MPTPDQIKFRKGLQAEQLKAAYARGAPQSEIDEIMAGGPALGAEKGRATPIQQALDTPSLGTDTPSLGMNEPPPGAGAMVVGPPGIEAMQSIEADRAEQQRIPPPNTDQVGMAPPPDTAQLEQPQQQQQPAMQLPDQADIPDMKLADEVLEERAQQAGVEEEELGGGVRRTSMNIPGTLEAVAQGLPKDTRADRAAQIAGAQADSYQDNINVERMRLQEARDAREVGRIAAIKERTLINEEKTLAREQQLATREEFQKRAQEESDTQMANVTKEFAEFKAMKVDPDRAMNNMDAGRKISFVLLAGIGGFFRAAQIGAGITPQGPSVADTAIIRIREIIKQDIAAQNTAIRVQGQAANNAYKMSNSVRQNLTDEGARLKANEALYWSIVESKAQDRLLKTNEPMEIANVQALASAAKIEGIDAMRDAKLREQAALEKTARWSEQQVQAMRFITTEERLTKANAEMVKLRKATQDATAVQRQAMGERADARYEAGQVREARIDKQASLTRTAKYEKESSEDFRTLEALRETIKGFEGPDAPDRWDRFIFDKLGGWASFAKDETKQTMRNFTDIVLRRIKDITGVAGRSAEMARIESVLSNTSSTPVQVLDALRRAESEIVAIMKRKQVAYPGIEKEFPLGVSVESNRQGLQRRIRNASSGPTRRQSP